MPTLMPIDRRPVRVSPDELGIEFKGAREIRQRLIDPAVVG